MERPVTFAKHNCMHGSLAVLSPLVLLADLSLLLGSEVVLHIINGER
jgi:hypothetical protein